MINFISAIELRQNINDHENFMLIDVRESFERELFNIGGLHIPMQSIFERIVEIPKDKKVVLYCQKGIRSMIVIQRLSERYGYQNLINLQGGMDAWLKMKTQ
jgi:adenylyltransferase/sulfurtransferase